jgi:hypothetical protein
MRRITKSLSFVILLTAFFVSRLAAQTTIPAVSCNESDVATAASQAATGDIVSIPAGTCTWTVGLSVTAGITVAGSGTPNTGANTFGSGTLKTVIVDDAGSSPLISVTGITYGQTFTLSLLDIEPASSSTSLASPVQIAGTCNSSGCPNIRIDNIGFGLGTPWTENGNSSNAFWMIRTDNVFGVIDHSTLPVGSDVTLANINNSAYLGVGGYGDNSWAQPDSFGTGNALYLENNIISTDRTLTDCDVAPAGGGIGGCRQVGRFNQVNAAAGYNTGFTVHGLDTDGRPQGGRQIEAYGNTVNCNTGPCTDVIAGFRSGTGFIFGNTGSITNGGFYNHVFDITVYRTVDAPTQWGACGGSSPYDTNDGVVYASGTVASASGGSGSAITVTDTSKSWTTNQWVPTGAPYSFYDVTKGFWMEIASNTSDSLTTQTEISEAEYTANAGDSYQILRATVCADQGGRGQGNYVSGATPSPASALNQALDPIYEWMDTATNLNNGVAASDTGRTIANRDWYNESLGQAAQTSPTSPFDGTSGDGHGTLANRPTTCTPRVGYWATDQGNWNQSGNAFGQGELFVCTATNTWTLYYTPYTYPHPLTQDPPTVNPPTNLQATPH